MVMEAVMEAVMNDGDEAVMEAVMNDGDEAVMTVMNLWR